MATGTYGTQRAAKINIDTDVSVYYHFRPTRNSIDPAFGDRFLPIPPSQILSETTFQNDRAAGGSILTGMYTLTLPLSTFGKKGIYTIMMIPKEVYTTIQDAPATLNAFPDVRGIVINSGALDGGTSTTADNSNLVGWRVDYYGSDGNKSNIYRIVTSNNFAEPVASATNSSSGKSVSYRYNDSSNLSFLTLSPSTAPSIKASALPYIGTTGEQIALVNTSFNPQAIEVEMVDNDLDGMIGLLTGDQSLDLDNGILTYYNKEHSIIAQNEIVQLKDSYTGKAAYNLRVNREDNIDKSSTWGNTIAKVK